MTMRNCAVRFFMMNKRLYKKPVFIFTFLLILAMSLFMVYGAGGDASVVRVSVFAQDKDDAFAQKTIERLKNESEILKLNIRDTEEDAVSDVTNGKADVAWVFPRNMQSLAQSFAQKPTKSNSFVRVYQREDDVFLMIANEKLYAVLYPELAFYRFRDFANKELAQADDEVLGRYYDEAIYLDNLVNTELVGTENTPEKESLLTAPVRGIMSVMTVICSLAAVMYFLQDKRRGAFALDKPRSHMLTESGYVFAAGINCGVFMLISLFASSLAVSVPKELLLMLLFVGMCVCFSVLMGELLHGAVALGSAIPALSLAMLVLCPVFIAVDGIGLQLLFPPYYYLSAVYNDRFIPYMLVYIAVSLAAMLIINIIKHRRFA